MFPRIKIFESTMPRVKDPESIGANESVKCKLCGFQISKTRNLKRHLQAKHKDFIQMRIKFENSSADVAIRNTIGNHVKVNSDIPEALWKRF